MQNFEAFLSSEFPEYFQLKKYKASQNHIINLLNEYKTTTIQTIITQFGLGFITQQSFKDGGNITTLHNARKSIYANLEDKNRFESKYDRKNYDKPLPKMRKEAFKNNEIIIDEYTRKHLPKDGRAHIDHVVSGKEIHLNDEARLYMSDQERLKMATSEDNLAWTEASINQSKGANKLSEWVDMENNKNKPGEKNAERFEIDREKTLEKAKKAEKYVNNEIKNSKIKYYGKNIITSNSKVAVKYGLRQSIGILLMATVEEFIKEMKLYFKNFKEYYSINVKVNKFKLACKNSFKKVLARWKELLSSFVSGSVSTFFSEILITIVNSFATTLRSVNRIITEGANGLYEGLKLLLFKPEDMTTKQAFKEGIKLITAAITTAVGLGLTETLVLKLKPIPFGDHIGRVIGGIFTGIITTSIVYLIDNFNEALNVVGNALDTIAYDFKVSTKRLRNSYNNVLAKIDEEYQGILHEIFNEYTRIYELSKKAFNIHQNPDKLFSYTVELAHELNVNSEKILTNKQNTIDFLKE